MPAQDRVRIDLGVTEEAVRPLEPRRRQRLRKARVRYPTHRFGERQQAPITPWVAEPRPFELLRGPVVLQATHFLCRSQGLEFCKKKRPIHRPWPPAARYRDCSPRRLRRARSARVVPHLFHASGTTLVDAELLLTFVLRGGRDRFRTCDIRLVRPALYR